MSSSPDAITAKLTAPSEEKGVEYWQRLAGKLQETIEKLEQQLKKQSEKIEQLEAEIRSAPSIVSAQQDELRRFRFEFQIQTFIYTPD